MENVVLLADENSRAWDFAERIKDYIFKEKGDKIDLQNLPSGHFRNKEMEINPTENIRKKDVYFISDSSKNPQEWWVELLLVRDMVLSASANSLTFVLPDMFYSRQDRKVKSRVPISARALANSISSGIKKIITMDLHSGQIQGFYPPTTPLDNLFSFPEVTRYLIKKYPQILDNLLIVSPDAGGVVRAKALMKKIGTLTGKKCDIAFVIKQRTVPGEVGEMKYIGPDPRGKNVLIVDDLIDSGGTLCSSAEMLKTMGVKNLICYGTHGLFTKGIDSLKQIFDLVLTSNTHFQENNGVGVIDVSSVFAEAIYRAQKGLSISQLFD